MPLCSSRFFLPLPFFLPCRENECHCQHFDSPRGLAFLGDGSLLVSDFNNHKMVVIGLVSGEMKHYGREGDWDGTYKRPQGLDIDLEGKFCPPVSKPFRRNNFLLRSRYNRGFEEQSSPGPDAGASVPVSDRADQGLRILRFLIL